MLVAIAKDEGPYISEWLVHHLAVGFTRILVYDDGSTDDTFSQLRTFATVFPQVDFMRCPAVGFHQSPQVNCYNHALRYVNTKWLMFLDIDEFLMPFRDYTVDAYLARVPADVSSVHVNWRCFGSGGRTDVGYGSVVEAFTRCSPREWHNNYHFKSIARASLVKDAHIHNIATSAGRRVLSDFTEFETISNGVSSRIVHGGIQINHYQSKTFDEFRQRMRRGDANYRPDHGSKRRDDSLERFRVLDVNDEEDRVGLVYRARIARYRRKLADAADLAG